MEIPHKDTPDAELDDSQLREKYAPITIGPTWQRCEDGTWSLPRWTLGWEIAGWMAQWLAGPNGEPSFKLTLEQLRFILWWYAVDENGEFVYRTGVLQRLKGWGKDPLAAGLCLVELVGPSRFSHFDPKTGKPVGTHHPAALVQIAAVNQEQTQNTTTMFALLMSDHFIAEYRVQAGKELIYARNGKVRLKAVTSSHRALEGGRSTFIILNETHHWIRGNNGIQMYETIDGNATKMDGRYLSITNAFQPGEDSVAERQREAYEKVQEGRATDVGQLYDSLEAPSHAPMDPAVLPTIIDMVRGDATWLKIPAIMKSILSTTMSVARSRRFWLNQVVAEADALFGPSDWDPLRLDTELALGEEIVLGFDGGKSGDSTALIAIRTSDSCAFVIGLWEKPDGPEAEGWEVNRELVDSTVREAFQLYSVQGMYCDVALWESYIMDWERDLGPGLAVRAEQYRPMWWDMRQNKKKSVLANERLMQTVFDGKLHHDGNLSLRKHVLSARRRTNNPYGVSFGKESRDSPKKIDAYAAMLLAFECLTDLRSRGKSTKKKTGRSWFI